MMENDCMLMVYHKEGLCGATAIPVHYEAGGIPLVGNVPQDGSWNGKHFVITGHIVDLGGCVALHVDKAMGCITPGPGSVA